MTDKHTPAECHVCGRHAVGLGIGNMRRPTDDPRWLCVECIPILEYIKSVKRFDPYELRAAALAGEKAGALLDEWDNTDLATLSEEQWSVFCRTMCQGFGDSMRELIRNQEAPF